MISSYREAKRQQEIERLKEIESQMKTVQRQAFEAATLGEARMYKQEYAELTEKREKLKKQMGVI